MAMYVPDYPAMPLSSDVNSGIAIASQSATAVALPRYYTHYSHNYSPHTVGTVVILKYVHTVYTYIHMYALESLSEEEDNYELYYKMLPYLQSRDSAA